MKKNELHELIKALSKSEKRYFKLQSSRQCGDGNYLRLFEVIEKQREFNGAALRQEFADETFVQQLHVTKNYLRTKILESLRQFHSQITKDAVVKDLLRNVEILFYKELFEQAKSELQRAEKLAKSYELHTAQIEVSRWKLKLEQTLHPNRYEPFSEILAEQKLAAEALQNNLDLWQNIVRSSRSFIRRESQTVEKPALFSEPAPAISLESKVLESNTLYVENLRNGQPEAAEKALIRLIQTLESHPGRVKEAPISYTTSVNNLAGFYVFRNEGEKALERLSKARAFLGTLGIPDRRRPVMKQIIRTTNIELEIYRNAADPRQHEAFYREAETFVKGLATKMPLEYLLSFQFQFAWICFLKKEFDRALHWLNVPINEWRKYSGYSVFRYVLILNLMVHCERRNLFVLRYFVENARRYFKKSGVIHPYEQEMLLFFSRIGQAPLGTYKDLYLNLRLKLFPESAESLVPGDALRMMDFRRWLD